MNQGQDHGHGETSHSVTSAAAALEGLLSDEEETQPDEAETEAPEEHEVTEETGDEESQSESEDESPDDEVAAEAPSEPRKFRVKVDGQDVEVTEDELLKGYSRTADYTRKTQQLSEKSKGFEQEQAAVRAERQRYATSLVELESAIKSMTQEPDWDQLRMENPAAFPEVFASWQLHQKRLGSIEAERQKAVEAVQADMQAQHSASLAAEREKLLEAVPAWKDAEVSRKERSALLDYGQKMGFSEQELHGVTDHRALVMLRKAMLFDQAETAKAAAKPVVQEKIDKAKVVAPGPKGGTKPPVSELTRRRQRLAKTGSDKDAASVLELMLGD